MRVAVTGHRPDKIGGYWFSTPQRIWIRDRLRDALVATQPTHCITGMALGVDQDFAYVCIEMGLPFTAAVPFEGQESKWPEESRKYYQELIKHASKIVIVSPGGYAAHRMQTRNKWMVDNCDLLIAVWDGSEGGTGNCVKYAQGYKPFRHINPMEFKAA